MISTFRIIIAAVAWAGFGALGPAGPHPGGAAQTPGSPPPATPRPQALVYHGETVEDPFLWMEDAGHPELEGWVRGRADAAARTIAEIPGRAGLMSRLEALLAARTSIHSLQTAGGRVFYLKSAPGSDVDRLFVRDSTTERERLLFDPATLDEGRRRFAVNYFRASPDGKRIALGVSASGSEDAVLRFLDAGSGAALDEPIDRVVFGQSVFWTPDGRGVLYNRLRRLGSDEPAVRRYAASTVFLHRMGDPVSKDRPIFGREASTEVPFSDFNVPLVGVGPRADFMIGVVARGVQKALAIYSAPVSSLERGPVVWRKAVDRDEGAFSPAGLGDDLFLLSGREAPRFKVIRRRMSSPDSPATVILPESRVVLTALVAAADGLYVQGMEGGLSRLYRISYRTWRVESADLPVSGTIREVASDPTRPGVLFRMESWTMPPRWFSWNQSSGRIRDTGWLTAAAADFSGIESREITVTGSDGALVPLSIVFRKGLPLDGSSPAILEAYGAYGAAMTPSFSPSLLAWLERGGVWALAHVRGGGEYGEDWHRAGMLENKPNSVKDLMACAGYLVDRGFTSRSRLGAWGASAGGVVIGGAMAERPDLFSAIVIDAGLLDCLRRENEANAQLGTAEFGSVGTPAGYRALLAMSPYHKIKAGTAYPAVLLCTGLNDPRVSPWQSFKMAARLQAATSSGRPVLLRVDRDAGHGIGETRSREGAKLADIYAFFMSALVDERK